MEYIQCILIIQYYLYFIFILWFFISINILYIHIYINFVFLILEHCEHLIWIFTVISSRRYRRLSITRDQWSAFYVHFNCNKSILGDSLLPHLPLLWLSRSDMRCNNYCSHPASFIISITLKLKGEQIPML